MQKDTGKTSYRPALYGFLSRMTRVFRTPRNLEKDPYMPLEKKKAFLQRWKDDRTRYLYEYGRDQDYAHDKEMQQVERSLDSVKRQEEEENNSAA